MKKFVLFTLLMSSTLELFAAVLSPSSTELNVKFTAEFITQAEDSAESLIQSHYQHVFGYFHSKTVLREFQINAKKNEGIGVPAIALNLLKVQDRPSKEFAGYRHIKYTAEGEFLFLNSVAEQLLIKKQWSMTLPFDLDAFYKESCTDSYYNSYGDFWYYYDPFRRGCEFLLEEPMAKSVQLIFSSTKALERESMIKLPKIWGDNGNGELLDIVTINGFATEYKNHNDEGRWAFEEMNQYFRDLGYSERQVARYQNRPVIEFKKSYLDKNNKQVHVRVTRLLADTSISKKNVTFAKFFKKAIERADVLVYAGHSGLGGNLNPTELEKKSGPLVFNKNKKQIFFFDGCATYSYYLKSFANKNPQLSILTNGLSSLFETETYVHQQFFNYILNFQQDHSWIQLMESMDSVLNGSTYMLNVGGAVEGSFVP